MTARLCTNCRYFGPVIGDCDDNYHRLCRYDDNACSRFEGRAPYLHSVRDQMPQAEGYYLVYRRNGLPAEVLHYDHVHGFGYWDGVDNVPVDDVTHWIACPPRPLEG